MKKNPDAAWKDAFIQSLQPAVLRGDYKTALALTKKALKEYPDEFLCRYQYAKILGDYADELPPARRKILKREAVRILRPLLRRLGGQPMTTRFGVCLNFYYQTEDFRGMYAFARRFRRHDQQKSYYAQGLAAGLIAQRLHENSKPAAARTWARKGVQAWSKYALQKDKYYFAHYSAAKAQALAGEKTKAMASLKRAAALGKRPITDWEFADVLKLL